jgi:hypothetical protein
MKPNHCFTCHCALISPYWQGCEGILPSTNDQRSQVAMTGVIYLTRLPVNNPHPTMRTESGVSENRWTWCFCDSHMRSHQFVAKNGGFRETPQGPLRWLRLRDHSAPSWRTLGHGYLPPMPGLACTWQVVGPGVLRHTLSRYLPQIQRSRVHGRWRGIVSRGRGYGTKAADGVRRPDPASLVLG